jgi:hypothetical protein
MSSQSNDVLSASSTIVDKTSYKSNGESSTAAAISTTSSKSKSELSASVTIKVRVY